MFFIVGISFVRKKIKILKFFEIIFNCENISATIYTFKHIIRSSTNVSNRKTNAILLNTEPRGVTGGTTAKLV